jgi:hypothetical protein
MRNDLKHGSYLSETSLPDDGDKLEFVDRQGLALKGGWRDCDGNMFLRNAHGAWLICNADLNFSISTCEIMPLILPDSTDVIKVWGKFDATHENVVAHVVGQAIIGDLWFFGTKVALYRYFGVAGDVASGVVYGKCQEGKENAYNCAWYM